MPELRRDPVVGYWTIISTERARRPVDIRPKDADENRFCPFCEGKENHTTPEIFAVRNPGSAANGPGWQVRVIESKIPILSPSKEFERFGQGIYDLMQGVGKHEIVVESPHHHHSLDELPQLHLEKVIQTYVSRMNELQKDERLEFALLFKNHGLISGSAGDIIRHTRSQFIATPVTPKRVKEELTCARNYFERKERCVFCDILKQESDEKVRYVAENANFFAFCPFASRSPFEMWILPKKHRADFGKTDPATFSDFASVIQECLLRLRMLLNDPPYNLIMHTAPFRHRKKEGYWKTIEEDYHWYLQIAPRLSHEAGFEWGSGIYINPTPPEDAALLLREASIEVRA